MLGLVRGRPRLPMTTPRKGCPRQRTRRAEAGTTSPGAPKCHINQSLLGAERRRGLSVRHHSSNIRLCKKQIGAHKRRGQHRPLVDLREVSRQMRQVEMLTPETHKRRVGSRYRSLVAQALRVQRFKALETHKGQQARSEKETPNEPERKLPKPQLPGS